MARPVRLKTTGQVRAIFGAAKERGFDDEKLRDIVESVTKRTRHISQLTHAEADLVIQRLKADSFVPRRTLQWRRKKAGVSQLVQETQLKLIADLATQRNWSADSLTQFCQRMIKRDRPVTTAQANTIIEALKSMNRRDKLWAA